MGGWSAPSCPTAATLAGALPSAPPQRKYRVQSSSWFCILQMGVRAKMRMQSTPLRAQRSMLRWIWK